jgi:DNA-binding CsgD family transcriptional regulator
MTPSLPNTTPAEVLNISPENLDVANEYLQTQSIQQVAQNLAISPDQVSQVLQRREVRAYIDNVFLDVGFNNRFRMRSAMDALIQRKFQELEEAEIGSNKDIADLLALSHKMSMDILDRQIQLEKLKEANIKSQVNVQVNEFGNGSKYNTLLEKIMKGDV